MVLEFLKEKSGVLIISVSLIAANLRGPITYVLNSPSRLLTKVANELGFKATPFCELRNVYSDRGVIQRNFILTDIFFICFKLLYNQHALFL